MKNESRVSYSDIQTRHSPRGAENITFREALKTPECFSSKPRILAFMGASGSGKDLAIEILTSLPGRRSVAQKLEMSEPVSIRVVPKLTDRPPRKSEVSKIPISAEEFTQFKESGQLIGEYELRSNGCRYAYRIDDLVQTCHEQFLVAEPSILHILELKKKFGDQIHCTFLTSSRDYREQLLRKRGSESDEEIKKRLDEGDGQTFVALLLAGKPIDFIEQFVAPDISENFQTLINTDPQTWETDGKLSILREKVGPELVDILEGAIANKGKVVDELINIDRFKTFIDDIVILDDKFVTDNPYQAGLFSESIIDTATRMLLNSENKMYSVDQTAHTNVICNLLVPESAKSVDAIFGVPYKDILDVIMANQEDRKLYLMGNKEEPIEARWVSYYEDRNRVFGLILRNPEKPGSFVSFRAMKPDESDQALINFHIDLSDIARPSDRREAQMAFMLQALNICEAIGIKQFHYAEHFDMVDEHDNVIGLIPRAIAHEEGRHIHRASSVLVWRWKPDEEKKNKKQLLMVRRSKHMTVNPGLWQSAPSGHLLPGETYAEAARRELREEVGADFANGVSVIHPLMPVRVYSDDTKGDHPQKENFYVFIAQVDEKASHLISPNYEAEKAEWMDIDTIQKMMADDPQQFRDAFRVSFAAVNWDEVTADDAPQAPTVRSYVK